MDRLPSQREILTVLIDNKIIDFSEGVYIVMLVFVFKGKMPGHSAEMTLQAKSIFAKPGRCSCLVTWLCYHLIAKPGNKTAAPLWPDPSWTVQLNSASKVYYIALRAGLNVNVTFFKRGLVRVVLNASKVFSYFILCTGTRLLTLSVSNFCCVQHKNCDSCLPSKSSTNFKF